MRKIRALNDREEPSTTSLVDYNFFCVTFAREKLFDNLITQRNNISQLNLYSQLLAI